MMGQPKELRRGNRRKVIQLLFDQHNWNEGRLTRPQLAELTGLSKVTVNAIVQELQDAGLLELARQEGDRGALGRVPQGIQLKRECGTVLAGDVQRGRIAFRVSAMTGHETSEHSLPCSQQQLLQALQQYIREVSVSKPFGPLRQVVLALPAPVSADGQVGEPNAVRELDTRQLQNWAHTNEIALTFENDANLAAFAAAEMFPDDPYLAALIERRSGTGLGLILDDQLYRGMSGKAGELGRSPWPTLHGSEVLEQLPDDERLRATTYLLASLAQTLDLQLLVLGLPESRAHALAAALTPLLPPSIRLNLVEDVDRLTLDGASRRAMQLARSQFIDEVSMRVGGEPHVA